MKNIIKREVSQIHSVIVDQFRLDCFVFYVTQKRSLLKSFIMPDKIISEPYVRILKEGNYDRTSICFELFINNTFFRCSSGEIGINDFSISKEIEICYNRYLLEVERLSKLTNKIQSVMNNE